MQISMLTFPKMLDCDETVMDFNVMDLITMFFFAENSKQQVVLYQQIVVWKGKMLFKYNIDCFSLLL